MTSTGSRPDVECSSNDNPCNSIDNVLVESCGFVNTKLAATDLLAGLPVQVVSAPIVDSSTLPFAVKFVESDACSNRCCNK